MLKEACTPCEQYTPAYSPSFRRVSALTLQVFPVAARVYTYCVGTTPSFTRSFAHPLVIVNLMCTSRAPDSKLRWLG